MAYDKPEKVTPELVKRCRDLWNAGKTAKDIGLEVGRTKNAVIGIAHRNGFVGRPSPIGRMTQASIDQIIAYARTHPRTSARRIAHLLGHSPDAVTRLLAGHDMSRKPQPAPPWRAPAIETATPPVAVAQKPAGDDPAPAPEAGGANQTTHPLAAADQPQQPRVVTLTPPPVPPPPAIIARPAFIPRAKPALVEPEPEVAAPEGAFYVASPQRGCHWPIGTPRAPGFRFCGDPRAPGGRAPYCAAHHKVAVARREDAA